jgi:hypothetical protein
MQQTISILAALHLALVVSKLEVLSDPHAHSDIMITAPVLEHLLDDLLPLICVG